jgi:hypothetical protein
MNGKALALANTRMLRHASEIYERIADDDRVVAKPLPTSGGIAIDGLEQRRTHDNFERDWRDLRRRAFLCRLVVFSYVPVITAVTLLLNRFPEYAPDHLGAAITVVWLAALLGAGTYRQDFRCPRCANFFFRRLFDHDPNAQNCVHCGLARGATSDIDLHGDYTFN